jgi:hypothetical protein
MSWQELQKDYIDPIPSFQSLPRHFSAEELYEFYRGKAQVSEIEAINLIRFRRKFKEFLTNDESFRVLTGKFKEISELSEKLFEIYSSKNQETL